MLFRLFEECLKLQYFFPTMLLCMYFDLNKWGQIYCCTAWCTFIMDLKCSANFLSKITVGSAGIPSDVKRDLINNKSSTSNCTEWPASGLMTFLINYLINLYYTSLRLKKKIVMSKWLSIKQLELNWDEWWHKSWEELLISLI